MLRTLEDPRRLARTFALVIPGWMTRRFNLLAPSRGYVPLDAPSEDVSSAFAAVSVPIHSDGPLGTRLLAKTGTA